jgi:hypothetical protein
MLRKGLLGLAAAAALVVSALAPEPAEATTFVVSFDGAVFDVSATLQTDALNNVTSITGTVTGPNGAAITGLEGPGNPNWIYDNQFNGAGNPYVSNGGILFLTGAIEYNLYSVAGNPFIYYLSTFNPDGSLYNPGDPGSLLVFTAAVATPLPPAIVLFGTALAGLGILGRRRRRNASRTGALAL